jgi:hypothetical protein
MAAPRDGDLKRLVPTPGVLNVSPETSLPHAALREAVNVDLTKEGRMARRRGRTQVAAAVTGPVHSLWHADGFPVALYVDDDTIRALRADGGTEPLHAGLALSSPVSWAKINDLVFWSNGVQAGLVTPDLEVFPWAPEAPTGQPTLTAVSDGGLDAGTYQVAVTFRDVLGRESGTGVAAVVAVGEGGGIQLSNIPPAPLSVTTVRVYRTGANDSSLRHVIDLPAGMPGVLLAAADRGKVLDTQHHRAMPPGHIVRYGHGRQWVARGNELLWSPALRYGLWSPATARLRFGSEIHMVEPIGDGGPGAGVFVAAGDRTYWLNGAAPEGFAQRIAHPVGVIPGSSAVTRGSVWGLETTENVVAWLASTGVFCIGAPSGVVTRFKDGEAVTDVGERAATLFREVNGVRQMVTALQGQTAPPSFRVADKAVVRTLRYDE